MVSAAQSAPTPPLAMIAAETALLKIFLQISNNCHKVVSINHGLRTPNEGINQRNLKFWANVADKICFGCIYKFGIGI